MSLVLLVLPFAFLYYYQTSFYASFYDGLQNCSQSLRLDLQGTSESFGWAGNLLRNAEVEGSIPFRSIYLKFCRILDLGYPLGDPRCGRKTQESR